MEVFNNSAFGTINIDCNNKITISASNFQPNDTDGIRLVIVKISECNNLNELDLFGGTILNYDTIIYDNLILQNTTKTIQLPQDGKYFFRIRDYYSIYEFSFITNNNLIKSILNRTQKIFCGCTSCNIINNIFKKTYIEELNLILDYILLFSLLEQCYNLTCLNCQFETINECDFINENFKGKEQYSEYKKNLILANIFNSLSLFLTENNNTCFNTQINQIKKCIKKNNILISDCIEEPVSTCIEYTWDLTGINTNTIVSMEYTPCNETLESSLTGTVNELGRIINICTNGLIPTSNYGVITNSGNCNLL